MATQRSDVPGPARYLYEDVKRELRRRIADGVYPPLTRIPSERQLTREFGLSTITVRRAVRDLVVEGLLRGRQGLGVFVARAPRIIRSLGADFRTSIGDELRRAGLTPGVKELSLALVPGDPATRRVLAVPRRRLLYRLEKLILGNGEPAAFDTTYLPRDLGDRLREELHTEFVFPLLAAHRIAVHHIDFRVEAGTLTEVQAAAFQLPVGFPVLVVDYTPRRPDGAAILTGRSLSRADRFAYAFQVQPGTGGVAPPRPAAARRRPPERAVSRRRLS
jgi:DNA-binding GntR family transcriptional regulator